MNSLKHTPARLTVSLVALFASTGIAAAQQDVQLTMDQQLSSSSPAAELTTDRINSRVAKEEEVKCSADFNQVGGVTPQDLFDYLAAYFGGDKRADLDGSGSITPADVFHYIAAFISGCGRA